MELQTAPGVALLSRRSLVLAAALAPVMRSLGASEVQEEPRVVDPPGPMSSELRERLLVAKEALEAKTSTTSDLLADPVWSELRPYTEFRELIRDHATASKTFIAPRGEPGERLIVAGRVLDQKDAPREKVLVYAYHTSAKGWYSDKAPHIGGNSGDTKHARLFGYCRTDAEGRFELDTIRPAGYPRSDLPQHIHFALTGEDKSDDGGEIWFDDDPRLTAEQRAKSVQESCTIVTPRRGEDKVWRCEAVLRLKRAK